MFDSLRLPGDAPASRGWRTVVGMASFVYVAALVAGLLVGPLVLTVVTGAPIGTALKQVAVVVGLAYVLGMALLLR